MQVHGGKNMFILNLRWRAGGVSGIVSILA